MPFWCLAELCFLESLIDLGSLLFVVEFLKCNGFVDVEARYLLVDIFAIGIQALLIFAN